MFVNRFDALTSVQGYDVDSILVSMRNHIQKQL